MARKGAVSIQIDPEFAASLPSLTEFEKKQLEENVVRDGCRDPLVLWGGTIVDGHNRYEICTRLGIAFKTVQMEFEDRDAVVAWIIRTQAGRRERTPIDKAIAAQTLLKIERKRARRRRAEAAKRGGKKRAKAPRATGGKFARKPVVAKKWRTDTSHGITLPHGSASSGVPRKKRAPRSREIAAKAVGLSGSTLEKAEVVLKKAPKAVIEKIRSGESTINREYQAIKRAETRERLKAPPLPTAKYRVIYADPPWKYGNAGTIEKGGYGRAEHHYPTMSIKELCDLPIKELGEKDSVLFLWVTAPLLGEVWPVVKAWGYVGKAQFIWNKDRHNFGHYNSVRHEILLVCTRGSCTPNGESGLENSVVTLKRTGKHSEKPEYFRELIDRLYPGGKRIELFARKKVDGWDSWGNEDEDDR